MSEFTLQEAKDLARETAGRVPPMGHETHFWTDYAREGITQYWLVHEADGFRIRTSFKRNIIV